MALSAASAVDGMRMRLIPLVLLTASLAHADTRADLDSTLAAFTGHDAIQVSIDLEISNQSGDAKKPTIETGTTSARIQDSPGGLQIFWDRQQLDAIKREKEDDGKEDGTSTRRAMEALSISQLALYLNAAPSLTEALDGAKLTEDKTATWEGRSARQLSFKLDPKLSEKDRKYIKEIEATAQVWLDAEGIPLAAERSFRVKGRAMLVITFESSETEKYTFARVGDRLVVTHHTKEGRGSGGGENNQRTTVATITVEPTAS